MPFALLRSYMGAMGSIDASENLANITVNALAFGNYSKADSARLMAKIKHSVIGSEPSRKLNPQTLAQMGIGFEVVKKESR